ncbi:iron chelate uptake ABC transporter family permease subunit, partial [Franconibacter pulveris]
MKASPRLWLVSGLFLLLSAAFAVWALGQGAVSLSIAQVADALRGDAPRNVSLIVMEWRLPRVTMALLLGAALGVSGAIFQSLMRNPLGSPDVMGFNTGAWSGVLVAMVLFGQHQTAIAA